MKNSHIILLSATMFALATGCKKEDTHGYIAPTTTNAVRGILTDARVNATQTFNVNAGSGGMVQGAHGTVITFTPNAFRGHDGTVVSGPVQIDLMEALSVSEMVRTNMQTVALVGGERQMLKSGGAVRLRATSGGDQVTMAQGAVRVHFPTEAPDQAMLNYAGNEDADGDVLWQNPVALGLDTVGIEVPDSANGGWINGSFYDAPWPANAFGDPIWPPYAFINCDHPIPPGGDSTDVKIDLPPGFLYNTMVWILLPDINCMVYMEGATQNGTSAAFPIRVGLQGTIVALSEQNGQYYSSFTPITVVMDHEQAITMQPTTLAQYQADLGVL